MGFGGWEAGARLAAAALLTMGFCGSALADPVAASDTKRLLAAVPAAVLPAHVGEPSRQPIGWVEFCRRYGSDCRFDPREADQVVLDQRLWNLVIQVNREVNRQIDPITDQDQWGLPERWDMAESGRGDCEDYVLVKRKRLESLGVPRRALLVTVVIDETGGGHAVLTLRTDRGDFILDNKRNGILSWQATGYRFVKRQSQTFDGWVAMDTRTDQVATSSRAP